MVNNAHVNGWMMSETPRTERYSALADQQRKFLDDAVARSGLTLTQIARASGLNPSTLTRFRNASGHGGLLSAATVAMVSSVTGEPAPSAAPEGSAPMRPRGFAEDDAALWSPGLGASARLASEMAAPLTAAAPHRIPWELRSACLEKEGYFPGDILVVDLNAPPVPGKIVCAQVYDWANPGNTRTVFRVYEPPFLLYAGPDMAQRKPFLVDNTNVVIKGAVVAMIRPNG